MEYIPLYTDFLKKHTHLKRPLSIVVDCSNGATGKILEDLLPKLGLASFEIVNKNPDPEFSAHGPNPLEKGAMDQLSKRVVEKKADFGVAFDADGDRAFFVDEKGMVHPSFVIAALLFTQAKPPFVADELVYQALKSMRMFHDEDLRPSRVGVFFIKQVMKDLQASTGAEFSGHFYFKDFFGADSGIFAMLKVLATLSHQNQTLSAFAASLPQHVIKNDSISITGKDWNKIERTIKEKYEKLADSGQQSLEIETREGITIRTQKGWLNARPSNTEPILKFFSGADTDHAASELLEEIKKLV
jgi:phosphomannomutase